MKQLRILFMAMLLAILIFTAAVLFLLGDKISRVPPENNIYLYILFILTIVLVPAGIITYRKILHQKKPSDPLTEKLQNFTTALIIRLAMIEGIILFGLIATLITGDYRILFIVLLLIFYFLMNYPSKFRVTQQLNLNKEETAAVSG